MCIYVPRSPPLLYEFKRLPYKCMCEKKAHYEGINFHFLTGISETLARDDFCAGVSIKFSTYHFRLNALCAIKKL